VLFRTEGSLLGNINIDFRNGMPYVAPVNAGDT